MRKLGFKAVDSTRSDIPGPVYGPVYLAEAKLVIQVLDRFHFYSDCNCATCI